MVLTKGEGVQKALTRERQAVGRDGRGLAEVATPTRARRRLRWRVPPVVAVCIGLLALLALAALFAPLIAPHDPIKQSLLNRNKPPAWMHGGSATYLFGTDNLGYDIF